jgi:excisionase family DNA binding protein
MKLLPGEVQAKIQPEHLLRPAYVYVRQSSQYQVEHHVESGRRQYALVEWALKLGWPKDKVHLLDEDQGQSSSTPQTRTGFGQLVSAIGRGEVGMVIALEASRLARNSPDWANLMYLCRWTNTLIADETGVYDPARSTDRMILGLRGQMSELELDTLIHRMVEARWSKASRGEVVTLLPAGYELDDEGKIVLTNDEKVSSAIRTVFSKFDELGSARQVSLFWRDQGLSLPVRRKELKGHPVVWAPPSSARIVRILRHPIFAGAFVFGATQTIRRVEEGTPPRVVKRRVKQKQWPVLLKDHHEGYITFEKFVQNQQRLMDNRTAGDDAITGAAREGRALLQGLVRCGHCGRRMYVSYGGRRPNWPKGTLYYQCYQGGLRDQGACQLVAGKRINEVVVEAFLSASEPMGVEAAMLAEEQIRRDGEEVERLWRLEVEKAEYEAQRAQRQYDAVEPENRVVARELEHRWNQKLAELEEVKRKAEQKLSAHRPLTDAEAAKAKRLGQDLPRVWEAPTTTDRDRKRLLRCLIEEVQLRTEDERHLIRVVWKGGVVTDRDLPRLPKWTQPHQTPEDTVDLVRRLATEFDDAQIARILNKQGRRGGSGKPFTQEAVRCIRRRNDIPRCEAPIPRDPRQGPFTADEAAAELGVSMHTVHRWLRDGVLPGKQATACAPWRIVLTEDVRRRLSGGDAPQGWVGLAEAARRLGLSKSNVAHLVKTGKLPAVRTTVGKRQCWRIDVSSENYARQPNLFDPVINRRSKEA